MKARYKVEDSKTGLTYFYTKIQWELVFVLIFIAGIGIRNEKMEIKIK